MLSSYQQLVFLLHDIYNGTLIDQYTARSVYAASPAISVWCIHEVIAFDGCNSLICVSKLHLNVGWMLFLVVNFWHKVLLQGWCLSLTLRVSFKTSDVNMPFPCALQTYILAIHRHILEKMWAFTIPRDTTSSVGCCKRCMLNNGLSVLWWLSAGKLLEVPVVL